MSETGASGEESLIKRAEQAATEGYQTPPGFDTAESSDTRPGQLSEEFIRQIGFNKVCDYSIKDRGSGIVEANDRLFNLAEEIGWHNVFEALFVDPQTKQLRLGIFVRQGLIPDQPDNN
jgi:hypothetical protein